MHGGGPTRTAEASILLRQAEADIVILTEFRAARGAQILQSLADGGLVHAVSAPPARGGNTVTVASRWAIKDAHVPHGAPAGRALACTFPALDLSVLGVHIPDESSVSARDRAWAATVQWGREHAAGLSVLAGDLNTSRTGIDPLRVHQTCEHCLGTLESLGFRDAWRVCRPPEPGISWFGPAGERQRLDAILVSGPLTAAIKRAAYDSRGVDARVSDHAILTVELDVSTPVPEQKRWMT